ncbi:MAG: GH116 family glycosyl-hydrolase [Spirochaetota bacterium]
MSDHEKNMFEQDILYDEITGRIQDHCTSRGFPMGGMGTGGFSIFTDGGMGMFRTNHNWFKTIGKTRYPRGSFFAIRCNDGQNTVTRILRGSYRGGREFANIENIAHTSFKGEVPFFELGFEDPEMPVQVSLSGFTSLIPHNVKDSSLPVAFFRVLLHNPSEKDMDVSLMASFENILGIGGSGSSAVLFPLDGPVTYNSTRKNYAERLSDDDVEGLVFKTGQNYGEKNPRRRVTGEYLLFSDSASLEGGSISCCTRWNSKKRSPRIIDNFSATGDVSGSEESRGNSGAFTMNISLAGGQKREINLYLLWWTPHHVIEKKQRLRKLTGRHHGTDYGHYYCNFFSAPLELARYCAMNRQRLEKETEELPAIIEDSSIPGWLKRYVLNSTDSMLINTVLPKDGTLYTMEAVPWGWLFGALTGTIDQRMASHPYSYSFFTEIDRKELLSFFNLSIDGRVPHGNGHADIALGSHDVPYGNPIKSFNKTEDWTDLPQSLIMQTGKMVLQTGDMEMLKQCWPSMVQMMQFLDSCLERNIPEGITTYDYMHYEPAFVYTAILHCATLKMMIQLGELLSGSDVHAAVDRELSHRLNEYAEQLQATERSCMDILWDQRGFFRTCDGRDTVFTASLAGDWISRYAGLGPVVDHEKALSHSRWQSKVLVDAYPVMDSRAGLTRPLVHREADPDGNQMPAVNNGFKMWHVNNPWQSIGYQAIEAIFLGRVEEGLGLIKRIWDKGWYEGYPWDMDHWGMRGRKYMTHPVLWLWDKDHHGEQGHVYMTHPVMWSVFAALTGVTYNAFSRSLTLSPRPIPGEDTFRIPVFLPGFWLMVEYNEEKGMADFHVLKSFGEPMVVEYIQYQQPDGSSRDIRLSEPVTLRTNERFLVQL